MQAIADEFGSEEVRSLYSNICLCKCAVFQGKRRVRRKLMNGHSVRASEVVKYTKVVFCSVVVDLHD